MTIPVTYLRYVAGEAGAGLNGFVAPGLTLSGAPYSATISSHVVKVNGVATTAFTVGAGPVINFTTDRTAGDIVEIWRFTEVGASLVTFPTPTGMNPTYFNKSITQLLLCIQELHGADSRLETLMGVLQTSLQTYVNTAIASVFEFSGLAAAVWSTTLSNGDETLSPPYSFTKGVLIVGGSVYNLANTAHVTLDNTGASTVITFVTPILGDHEAILIIF